MARAPRSRRWAVHAPGRAPPRAGPALAVVFVLVLLAGPAGAATVWSANSVLPVERMGAAVVWDGSAVLVLGGETRDGQVSQVLRFDPATDTLSVLPQALPGPRSQAAAAWTGDIAVLAGGHGPGLLDTIVRYRPGGGVTHSTERLPSPMRGASAVWTGEEVLIFGGRTASGYSSDVLVYDPATDTLRNSGGRLQTGRAWTAAAWDGSAAYIIGGRDEGGLLDEIVRFDPTIGHAALVGRIGEPLLGLSAVWDGEAVVAFGGLDPSTPSPRMWRYVPGASQAELVAQELEAAVGHAGAAWTGQFAVLAGGTSPLSDRVQIVDPLNLPPTATANLTRTGLRVEVDASASSDPNGDPLTFSWDWGDGTASSAGDRAVHTYAADGRYAIELTVDDRRRGVSTWQRTVDVENEDPVATMALRFEGLVLEGDATASVDPDGTDLTFSWDWGDGSDASTGPVVSHGYAEAGTYRVRLSVTDANGATAALEQDATVAADRHGPTAAFDVALGPQQVSVNGSPSSDVDGDELEYSWLWGDGSPADTGLRASHVYAAPGDYEVVLTVEDPSGLIDTVRRTVVVERALRGVVEAGAGAGVAGAPVMLVSNATGDWDILDRTTTDDRGRFGFQERPDATHVLLLTGGTVVLRPVAPGEPMRFLVDDPGGSADAATVAELASAARDVRVVELGEVSSIRVASVELDGFAGIERVEFRPGRSRDTARLIALDVDGSGLGQLDPPSMEGQWFALSVVDAEGDPLPVSTGSVTVRTPAGLGDASSFVLHAYRGPDVGWTTERAQTPEGSNVHTAPFEETGLFVVAAASEGVLAAIASAPWPVIGGAAAGAALLVAGAVLTRRHLQRRGPGTPKPAAPSAATPQVATGPADRAPAAAERVGTDLPGRELLFAHVGVELGGQRVLESVGFAARQGEVVVLVGPSGAGKSTLLRCLMGEVDHTGEISVFGLDPAGDRDRFRSNVGYVPQDLELYPDMTVEENVRYFGRQYGLDVRTARDRARRACTVLGLSSKLEQRLRECSGGEQRRVSIAAALVQRPALLVLDEPTSGLDPITRKALWNHLRRANHETGVTILVTTHYLDEAELADRVVVLDGGHAVADDTPNGLLRSIPGSGRLVVVEFEEPTRALQSRLDTLMDKLRERDYVERVEYGAYTARVIADDPHRTSRALIRVLDRMDIGVRGVKLVDARMEDVFSFYASHSWEEAT